MINKLAKDYNRMLVGILDNIDEMDQLDAAKYAGFTALFWNEAARTIQAYIKSSDEIKQQVRAGIKRQVEILGEQHEKKV